MIWHHNDYSEEAISEMQKEAEERIKAMQSRTRLFSDVESISEPSNNSRTQHVPMSNANNKNNQFGAIDELLGNLKGDKLIIVAIMWLLWNEHADGKLLLALAYMLM